MSRYLNELDLLRALGVHLALDFDNSLDWEIHEASIDLKRLNAYILDHQKQLADKLRGEARIATHVYCGGPFDGRKHGRCAGSDFHAIKIAPAKWVAYCTMNQNDGRLVYCGETTSQKKARALAIKTRREKYGPANHV